MIAIITLPIVLQRVAEISKKKKEKEIKERYGMEDIPKDTPVKKKSAWENMSHGKEKTE